MWSSIRRGGEVVASPDQTASDPKGNEPQPGNIKSVQAIGADQISRFGISRLVQIAVVLVVAVVAALWYADYWVWLHVSYSATFEAIAAESNVALAVGALFAIWSSSDETRNTREMLRQMSEQHIELHKSGPAQPGANPQTSGQPKP